ncbi:hypothetical protein B0H14DRAFT_3448413 [Mycena olivaceomarginata]|nr:hypothetical protein B0H14DRAFT_3448413 [Mycena olivaceomarginata]
MSVPPVRVITSPQVPLPCSVLRFIPSRFRLERTPACGLLPPAAPEITSVSPEDAAARATHFYRWHIDAAYDLSPPCVMTLYVLRVPRGLPQVCRYDDGTGDALSIPLGTTAFVAGKTMWVLLPPELKSVVVRTRVMYAPHRTSVRRRSVRQP